MQKDERKGANMTDTDTAITQKINELYSQYGKSNEAVYNQPISDDLFSPELKKTLETAINASKADIEKVKKSDHPDEKPLIFEGAIFSSLYEGYTHYTIQSIDVKSNTADVIITLEHAGATVDPEKEIPTAVPKVVWNDKIHFVNIANTGWRIDNITFDKKFSNSEDLKTSLTDFIQYSKQ
ncbi:hypothetical protein BOQ64_13805 [Chryseobacterium sp. CH25]|nr:hypothetical protein BOQ64_13805 [Chryseobacterium sp. CH25]RXM64771.1 hypothetical protein BOQ60_11190 [Chryseobacterium sp. CH1]